MDKNLSSFLEKHGIEYTVHEHAPTFTVAESKKIKKIIPGVHTKNLFLKSEDNRFYLVCLPAEKRLPISLLKKMLDKKSLSFASEEELQKELHVAPGHVSLFSTIYAEKTILLLDQELWDAPAACFHPNENTQTLEIDHIYLVKFYNILPIEKHIISLPYEKA